MKYQTYKIVEVMSTTELERRVNEFLDDDWILVGGPFVYWKNNSIGNIFAQAITKESK